MRKIRVLALLLAIMMVLSAFLVSCKDTEDDKCADGEHSWKKETTVQKRSCTDALIKQRECRDCGEIEQWEDAPPTGHRYDSSQKVYMEDATCTQDGHTVNHCYLGCGSEADKIEVLPGTALGHTYVTYNKVGDGTTEVAQCIRCAATNTRILEVVLNMSGDRSHLSFQTLKLYDADGLNTPVAANFVNIGNKNHLHVERPASGFVGSAEFGAVITPRADVLAGVDYVVEVEVKLDKVKTGALNLITGKKSTFNQRIDFVKYVPGTNGSNGTLESVVGTFYELTDGDYANGITVAAVLNDTQRAYQIYVNNKLASQVIAYEGDYYTGLELGTITVAMSKEYSASSFDIAGIYIYAGSEPKAYDGESVNIGYGVEELVVDGAPTGEKVAYKLPVDSEGHTHGYSIESKVVASTCCASGYTVMACSCGGERIVDVVGKSNHLYGNNVEIVAPTCDAPGYLVKTCVTCGIKDGEQNAPKLGHELPEVGYSVKEPTCTDGGYNYGYCIRCGIEYIDENTRKPSLGCALGENFTVVAPTCTTDGYTHGPCVRCQNDYTDPGSIIGTYGHYSFNAPSSVQELTCEQDGVNTYTCLGCGQEYVKESETVKAEGHELYSKIATVDGKECIITKCTKCDYKYEYDTADASVLDYSKYKTFLGGTDKILMQSGADPDRDALIGFNTSSMRYATVKAVTKGDNKYIEIKSDSLDVALKNEKGIKYPDHAMIDWGSASDAAVGRDIVFDVCVKFPEKLANGEANGEMHVRPYIGGSGLGDNSKGCYKVKSDGSIIVGMTGVEIAPAGTINKNDWTRISLVFRNITAGSSNETTAHVYVNGEKMWSDVIDTSTVSSNVMSKYRITFRQDGKVSNSPSNKDNIIYVDNMVMYYGDAPAYNLDIRNTFNDISNVKFDEVTNVPTESTFEAEAGIEYLSGQNHIPTYIKTFGNNDIKYKQFFAVTLVDRGTGEGAYKAVNIRYEKDVTPSTGTETGTDSHLLLRGAPKSGTYTLSYDLTFNEITGSFTLLHGRKERTAGDSARPDRDLVRFDNGNIVVGNTTIGTTDTGIRIEKGQRYIIDLVDKQELDKLYIYVDGVLRYIHDYSADTDYASVGGEAYSFGIKIFNVAGNGGVIDVDLNGFDLYEGLEVPIGYIGVSQEDQVVKNDKENIIVSFNENSTLENALGMASKDIPGRYFYESVNDGTSYLALKMSTVKVAVGGVSIDYIGYKGFNVGSPTVDEDGNPIDGAWVLTTRDQKTNGRKDLAFDKFSGLPTRVVDGNTLYDMSGYKAVRLRYFVSSNLNNAKGVVLFANPNDEQGRLHNYKKWLDLAPGWHDETVLFTDMEIGRNPSFDSIQKIVFYFSGYGGTGDGNGNAVDGLGFHLAEIALVEVDQVLTGTGYAPKMLGHECEEGDFGSVVSFEGTCTKVGYSYKSCAICGYKKVTVTPATGHNMVMKDKVDATCESYGSELWECDNPDCNYSHTVVLEKTLHNFEKKAHDDNLAAGCLTTGVQYYTCTNEKCDLIVGATKPEFRENIAALGHDYIGVMTEGNTCEGITVTASGCSRCEYSGGVIDQTEGEGHEYDYIETVAPTCDEKGREDQICTKCGKESGVYRDVDALGHKKPAQYLIEIIPFSCQTDSGICYKYDCLRCGEEQTENSGIKHMFGEWIQEVEATCVAGHREKYCFGCNGKYSEIYAEDEDVQFECAYPVATGKHSYGEPSWNTEDEYQVRIRSKKCINCQKEIILETIAAKYDDAATKGFVFMDNGNGQYALVGFEAGAEIPTELVIPGKYSGKTVVVAFKNALTNVTKVTIMDGAILGDNAFRGWTALEEVVLPESVTEITAYAFAGCTKLEEITLPESCTEIKTMAFAQSGLKHIVIKGELKAVQQFAFAECNALTNVTYITTMKPEHVIAEVGNDKLLGATWQKLVQD